MLIKLTITGSMNITFILENENISTCVFEYNMFVFEILSINTLKFTIASSKLGFKFLTNKHEEQFLTNQP